MKKCFMAITLAVLGTVCWSSAAKAEIFVDFANSAAPTTGQLKVTASGFTAVELDNNPAAAAGQSSFTWLGPTTIGSHTLTITASASGGTFVNNMLRSLNRNDADGAGPSTAFATNTNAITQEWIAASQVAGTGVTTDPTVTIKVTGFAANEQLIWTSYHHDGGSNGNQTGLIDYVLQGSAGVFDISNEIQEPSALQSNIVPGAFGYTSGLAGNQAFTLNTPSTTVGTIAAASSAATLTLVTTADALGEVSFSFSPKIAPGLANNQGLGFAIINGFSITAVPEPTSMVVLGMAGIGGVAARIRNRRKASVK